MASKQKQVVAFDFETIADKSMLDSLPPVKPSGTLKDPAKISADIAKKTQKQILDMGLNPATNIICAAGWCSDKGSGCLGLAGDGSPEGDKAAEAKLIRDFWDIMDEYDHYVTYNGRNFDMRCILLHGMEYGIRPGVTIDCGRYNKGNHTDMRQVLAGSDNNAKGTLDFFAKKFLGRGKTEGMSGSQVQSYYDMGMLDEILEYGEDDAVLTLELYKKALTAGLM